MELSPHSEIDIGRHLHNHRTSRGLTIRDLAKMARCSASLLSQIENNKISPTVKRLQGICHALSISISDFMCFQSPPHEPVHIVNKRNTYDTAIEWGSAKLHYLLPREFRPPFTTMLLTLASSGSTPERNSLESLTELSLVLRGNVELLIEDRRFTLSAGDRILYDLAKPHKWLNSGPGDAEVLLINGNSFDLFEEVQMKIEWRKRFKFIRKQENVFLFRSTQKSPEKAQII